MILQQNKAEIFPWFSNRHIQVRGYFFDKNGKFYEKEEVLGCFPPELEKEQLISIVESLNGCFAITYETTSFIFASVDRLRTFPLFYRENKGEFYLSDNTLELS